MKTVWLLALAAAGMAVAADKNPVDTKKAPPPPEAPQKAAPPEAATAAVAASRLWASGTSLPLQGRDGKVMFVFGDGVPTITCAPLRVCVIELEGGEHITDGGLKIGDSVRWDVSPALAGTEPNAITLVVIKPRFPGLDTNLVLATDRRRVYYIRLLSSATDYVARIAFEYPEADSERAWARVAVERQTAEAVEAQKRDKAAAEAKEKELAAAKAPLLPAPGVYKITSTDKSLEPVSVRDDGQKTYIKMPPSIAVWEMPVLFILSPEKKWELVNFRVVDGEYVVDRLFTQAHLVLGTGKHARKVTMIREEQHGTAGTSAASQQ